MVKKNKETWFELKSRLSIGDKIEGEVVQVEHFGIFLNIGEHFRGIVLAPQITDHQGIKMESYPKIGDFVKGVIIDFSDDKNIEYDYAYVSISLKKIDF